MTKPTSLKWNAFSLLIMQAINYLVPLITLPYLTRTLGVIEYGVLNLALSIIQYAILFTNFGFNLSTTQYIAIHRNNPLLISRAFWETILAKSLLMVLSFIILLGLTLHIESFYKIRWIIYILSLQIISTTFDPIWFFQGIEKLSKVSLINSAIRFLNIPLLILLVHSATDIEKAAFVQSLITILVMITNLYFVYQEKIISFIKIRQLYIKKTIILSLPIFVGTAAISLYNTSTPIILGTVNDYQEVGIYSASFKIRGAITGIFVVLGQVFYPRVNHLFSQNLDKGYRFIRKMIFCLLPITILGFFLFYFIVPNIVPFILGQDFEKTSLTLKIMAPMMILTPYAIMFSNYLLLPLKFKKTYYTIPLITGCIHLLYTIPLSHLYGAIGASWAILTTETISFLLLLYFSLKKTKIKMYLKLRL